MPYPWKWGKKIENKGIKFRRKGVKVYLCVDNMIIYLESILEGTKFSELISKVTGHEVTGYIVSTKSMTFLGTSNKKL